MTLKFKCETCNYENSYDITPLENLDITKQSNDYQHVITIPCENCLTYIEVAANQLLQ